MDKEPWRNNEYFGREQALVKHTILEKYLERFAIIIGRHNDEITYIDCFSGPWNVQSDNLSDSSFSIALSQLRRAQETVREKFQREIQIRCLFLEKQKSAFERLQKFASEQSNLPGVKVTAINDSFEHAIPCIEEFIRNGCPRSFPFIFIDPKGWTGFSMKEIVPLLQIRPCEILITFMTSFIVRFIEKENIGFERLFGDDGFRVAFAKLTGEEREDAIVLAYAEKLKRVGNFSHVPVTIVPHPEKDRTHYHLVYATRSLRGLQVFKDAEKKALQVSESVRAEAKRRHRENKSGQQELFGGNEPLQTSYSEELSERYHRLAKKDFLELMNLQIRTSYDVAYATVLRYPLVTEETLRVWISEVAEVLGMSPRERVPKIGLSHMLALRDKE